jgi:hypothetical protein
MQWEKSAKYQNCKVRIWCCERNMLTFHRNLPLGKHRFFRQFMAAKNGTPQDAFSNEHTERLMKGNLTTNIPHHKLKRGPQLNDGTLLMITRQQQHEKKISVCRLWIFFSNNLFPLEIIWYLSFK